MSAGVTQRATSSRPGSCRPCGVRHRHRDAPRRSFASRRQQRAHTSPWPSRRSPSTRQRPAASSSTTRPRPAGKRYPRWRRSFPIPSSRRRPRTVRGRKRTLRTCALVFDSRQLKIPCRRKPQQGRDQRPVKPRVTATWLNRLLRPLHRNLHRLDADGRHYHRWDSWLQDHRDSGSRGQNRLRRHPCCS
jgi:hypothetical protein